MKRMILAGALALFALTGCDEGDSQRDSGKSPAYTSSSGIPVREPSERNTDVIREWQADQARRAAQAETDRRRPREADDSEFVPLSRPVPADRYFDVLLALDAEGIPARYDRPSSQMWVPARQARKAEGVLRGIR